ncbi:hypothetical protein PAMA_002260 [Pampus argenteus]
MCPLLQAGLKLLGNFLRKKKKKLHSAAFVPRWEQQLLVVLDPDIVSLLLHSTDGVMILFKFACAIITRALFICVSLVGVWRVTWVKKTDSNYWFLTFLLLPLVIEMIITLKRRKGQDYKWCSPPIFLFLITIIPSIWILELHHQQNKTSDLQCRKLDSWNNLNNMMTLNETQGNNTNYLENIKQILSHVCSNDWILALHQILLILVIMGKWLLPRGGGITRDELSQLLLIFVGTAADILEFTSETLSDVKWVANHVACLI